ncbi:MAG: YrhK family protein [Sulfitobacter sp.]
MKLFRHETWQHSDVHKHVYALFEIAYTLADFMAALLFIIGSIMFFYDYWQHVGTWFFLIGSVLFAAKPTLRQVREICLYRMGDFGDLSARLTSDQDDKKHSSKM